MSFLSVGGGCRFPNGPHTRLITLHISVSSILFCRWSSKARPFHFPQLSPTLPPFVRNKQDGVGVDQVIPPYVLEIWSRTGRAIEDICTNIFEFINISDHFTIGLTRLVPAFWCPGLPTLAATEPNMLSCVTFRGLTSHAGGVFLSR
jgi:hypothetical protein